MTSGNIAPDGGSPAKQPSTPTDADAAKAAPKRRRRRATVEPDVELGSLSQKLPVPRGTKKCRACGSDALTRVPMSVGNGTPATFVSCQDCEERGWVTVDSGEYLDLDAVLARSRSAEAK